MATSKEVLVLVLGFSNIMARVFPARGAPWCPRSALSFMARSTRSGHWSFMSRTEIRFFFPMIL